MSLTDAQIERYSRQIVLPEIGGRGQEIVLQSAVAIIGAGPVARTAALYLSAAGIGRLTLLAGGDDQAVAVAALLADLDDLNPELDCHAGGQLDAAMQGPWASRFDVLLETTGARSSLVLADAVARAAHRPLVAGAVGGSRGWVSIFVGAASDRPCALCWPAEAPGCDADTVGHWLAPAVAGTVGSLLALEVLKIRLNIAPLVSGLRLRYDANGVRMDRELLSKNPACRAGIHSPVC